MQERPQTAAEERANALSHGLGCLLAVAALPVLVTTAVRHGHAVNVVGVTVFATTMILLYLVSALFHALPPGRAKQWCNTLDHVAIYLFIAGSYTPFALGVLRGGWGWTVFGLVWALAAVGTALKLLRRLQHPLLSTGVYVAMGWLVLIAAAPLVRSISGTGLAWLVAGGLAYTVGAVFFLFDGRLRYGHFVWHLFVLTGSTCHFFAALWHAAGQQAAA